MSHLHCLFSLLLSKGDVLSKQSYSVLSVVVVRADMMQVFQ